MAEGAVLGLSDSVDQQILQAVVQGDVQELSILLRNFGKDPSSIIGKKGRTPLHFGCLSGNAACVTLLLTIVQTVRFRTTANFTSFRSLQPPQRF
jgi:ankyrin repeat protein